MDNITLITLTFLIWIAALLYSSVGHAGASAYLAAMTLLNLAPDVMKPTALVLNILVATIATIKFYRAGHFVWHIFLPLTISSVPAAFIASSLEISGQFYKTLLGFVLLYAAYRLFTATKKTNHTPMKPLVVPLALFIGAVIGVLSGLTGTGGGIFLTPVLLFLQWAEPRQASGISAAFILVNSCAGLLGDFNSLNAISSATILWAIAAITGGWIGASYGSQQANNHRLRQLLSIVLVIAGIKLILA